MEKKQTAVEFLYHYMLYNEYYIGNDLIEAIEQAKEMEKEQMRNTWEDGFSFQSPYNNFKEYYNKTYSK